MIAKIAQDKGERRGGREEDTNKKNNGK